MFVYNEPAMFTDGYLAVSDLHLGISNEIGRAGITVPSQAERLAEKLNALKKQTKTDNLVVVGDFKHSIPSISRIEHAEIPAFLRKLEFNEIVIVKGNHDGRIESVIKGVENVRVRKSFAVGDFFFTHGHRTAKTEKSTVVIGHNHPGVRFRDRFGAVYIEPCWVRGKIRMNGKDRGLIIMPAFNELSGRVAVNEGRFMGPVATKIRDAHAVLLDGTDLGAIKQIK